MTSKSSNLTEALNEAARVTPAEVLVEKLTKIEAERVGANIELKDIPPPLSTGEDVGLFIGDRQNRSTNNHYYSEREATLWITLFKTVYETFENKFVSAAAARVSQNTLYSRSHGALKWLAEKSQDKAYWQRVKLEIRIRRVSSGVSGILIQSNRSMERINAAVANTQVYVSKILNAKVENMPVWKNKVMAWILEGFKGSRTFEFPTVTDEPVMLSPEDEFWFNEAMMSCAVKSFEFNLGLGTIKIER